MITTSDLVGVVARAPNSWGTQLTGWLQEEVDKLGATADDVVTVAVAAMTNDDRNVRVKMLRVLALFADERATAAVLAGLSDPARRVRDVAIKSTRPHHMSAEIVERLRAMVDDEAEVNGLRREAFLALSSAVAADAFPAVTRDAVVGLMDLPRFRLGILVRLCKSRFQSESSRAILHEFVRTGSTEEAVMATRALCGHMLVRVDGWMPNDVRRRVRDTYDPAPEVFGTPSCWIPRDEALAIAAEVGYPAPV
ncbi:MAG TPA: HEAT repeat domain-containing protein [Acidimicrobiales bacterium]|nr:HEAT repeat domain-containing protein [Acidimicrobiales bacterium]